MTTTAAAPKGLEGVVAAETTMSFIDGEKGILEYVGIPIGELSATIVLHKGSTVTMPVQIYRHVIDGDLGPAAALSTLLLAATGLALVLIERVRAA